MHRDQGYKRFFNTILLFAAGYNFIILSGNFETLFIGWEIKGLCSFLLIAFYRNRYLPVKNALKTVSNYRISDVSLMLAMWMMHHLTHQNISFTQLGEAKDIAVQTGHTGMALFIVCMIILAATVKSAQFPFTTWLPRAMEGPTSSSAIFYKDQHHCYWCINGHYGHSYCEGAANGKDTDRLFLCRTDRYHVH
jgi:NADH:ubiquinone oxidoreductase subunit 5 (subunit L)/multisubunit Na+/H+ antiporter MnhA subunit